MANKTDPSRLAHGMPVHGLPPLELEALAACSDIINVRMNFGVHSLFSGIGQPVTRGKYSAAI